MLIKIKDCHVDGQSCIGWVLIGCWDGVGWKKCGDIPTTRSRAGWFAGSTYGTILFYGEGDVTKSVWLLFVWGGDKLLGGGTMFVVELDSVEGDWWDKVVLENSSVVSKWWGIWFEIDNQGV